jgi:GTPase KRas protein
LGDVRSIFINRSTAIELIMFSDPRNCHGFILVYSITQRSSFERLQRYHADMLRTKRGTPKFILVGNKYDKMQQREVSTDEGYRLANEWGCPFYETSAKTRHNVEEAFTDLVRKLRESTKEKSEQSAPGGGKPPRPVKPKKKFPYGCVIL